MLAVCSICGDIFTGVHPEVVHSTPCGHLFHYVCLIEWLQRSKTCPQCRARVNEEKTTKLYFQISNQSTQDAGGLENELQNLKFKFSMQSMDIKKLAEETEMAKSQADGLRKKVKQREEEIRNHETVVSTLQDKIKIFKSQIKSLAEVQCQAAELASKLEKYESVDKILKGSAQQASAQLAVMKDKDTSTLCTCISTLKKEIDQYKEKNRYMQSQLRKTEKELSSTFAEIDKLRGLNSVLSRAVEQFKSPRSDKNNLSKSCILGPTDTKSSKVRLIDLSLLDESEVAGSSRSSRNEVEQSLSSNKRSLSRGEDESLIDLSVSPVRKSVPHLPSPRSPIKLSRFNEFRGKTLLNKTRIISKVPSVGTQCYDGFGGHLKEEVTSADRASLLREIEDRKPNKLQLPRKRLKPSLKSSSQSMNILQFCSKKP